MLDLELEIVEEALPRIGAGSALFEEIIPFSCHDCAFDSIVARLFTNTVASDDSKTFGLTPADNGTTPAAKTGGVTNFGFE